MEHGVILTVTTTLVLVVAIPLSPAAVGVTDPIHQTITQMIKLDCGVQQCHQLVNAFKTYIMLSRSQLKFFELSMQ